MLDNQGSTARDFLAFERNFLTQVRLFLDLLRTRPSDNVKCRFGVLLSLLSSSFLLHARIPTPNSNKPQAPSDAALAPFGYVYFVCGLCGICLALCVYYLVGQRHRKVQSLKWYYAPGGII